METLTEYFTGWFELLADAPSPGADPFLVAGMIASADDSTDARRALALSIERWALAYAAAVAKGR